MDSFPSKKIATPPSRDELIYSESKSPTNLLISIKLTCFEKKFWTDVSLSYLYADLFRWRDIEEHMGDKIKSKSLISKIKNLFLQ